MSFSRPLLTILFGMSCMSCTVNILEMINHDEVRELRYFVPSPTSTTSPTSPISLLTLSSDLGAHLVFSRMVSSVVMAGLPNGESTECGGLGLCVESGDATGAAAGADGVYSGDGEDGWQVCVGGGVCWSCCSNASFPLPTRSLFLCRACRLAVARHFGLRVCRFSIFVCGPHFVNHAPTSRLYPQKDRSTQLRRNSSLLAFDDVERF